MAIQVSNFISGKMANVIFYQQYGKWIARSAPGSIKQSSNTKKRNQNFGVAATAGRLLREQLGNDIPFPKDKLMQSRFSGAIIKWLGKETLSNLAPQQNLPYLSGFSFNNACDFGGRVKVKPAVSRPNNHELLLQLPAFIPEQAFTAPAGTALVEYCIIVAACNLLQANQAALKATQLLSFAYNDVTVPAQQYSLPMLSTDGSLLLTVASVRFLNSAGQLIEKLNYLPAEVVDARYV